MFEVLDGGGGGGGHEQFSEFSESHLLPIMFYVLPRSKMIQLTTHL